MVRRIGVMKVWMAICVLAGACAVEFVSCMTTAGSITLEIHPEWAPNAAQHFLTLVDAEFYTDIALYRSIRSFLVQFGISDKAEHKKWHTQYISDDKNLRIPFKRGMVSFAANKHNDKSTQLFIAYEDLPFLGEDPWVAPFAIVVDGLEALDAFSTTYGDGPPFGQGPDQLLVQRYGNEYLKESYPEVDYIHWCDRVWAEGVTDIKDVFLREDLHHATASNIPAHCLVITFLVMCSAVSAAMYMLRNSVLRRCVHDDNVKV